MEVSVTTLPWLGNARITEFADNAEMENAILASSCVFPAPPVYLPKLKTWALDGGYSDFQLIKVRHCHCGSLASLVYVGVISYFIC